MSSLDVARRLDSLRLLSGGSRGALPRQQSVAATIDWSYRLLAEPERTLFARLSVFAGGFDLDAAHGVSGEDGADQHDTFDLLTGLVDKSMVTMRSDGGVTRYGVLETLRAYGRERLCDNGVDDTYARRHTEYFAELAQRAASGMHGPDEQAWVERMLPDYDNLRAAFEHAIGDDNLDLALRLVTSLSEFVHLRIGFEASGWAERALKVVDPDRPLFAAAVGFAARGAWNRGDQARARELASLADGRVPGRGNGRVAYPGDVLADVALYGRPNSAGVDAVLCRDLPGRAPYAGGGSCRSGGSLAGCRCHGQPDGAVDGTLRAGSGPQEIRPGQGAGAIRRSGGVGRLGPEFLVARHRVDGSGGDPWRARRSSKSGKRFHRCARPLGPSGRLEPAVAEPSVRDAVPESGRRPRRCGCTPPGTSACR